MAFNFFANKAIYDLGMKAYNKRQSKKAAKNGTEPELVQEKKTWSAAAMVSDAGFAGEVLADEMKRKQEKQAQADAAAAKAMHHSSQFGSSSHYEKWKAEQLKKKK